MPPVRDQLRLLPTYIQSLAGAAAALFIANWGHFSKFLSQSLSIELYSARKNRIIL